VAAKSKVHNTIPPNQRRPQPSKFAAYEVGNGTKRDLYVQGCSDRPKVKPDSLEQSGETVSPEGDRRCQRNGPDCA
jgi:hypothetical protein